MHKRVPHVLHDTRGPPRLLRSCGRCQTVEGLVGEFFVERYRLDPQPLDPVAQSPFPGLMIPAIPATDVGRPDFRQLCRHGAMAGSAMGATRCFGQAVEGLVAEFIIEVDCFPLCFRIDVVGHDSLFRSR
jgi:hypothetical protein